MAGLQRHRMGDSLLACLMMICSNGPSLHEKEEVEKFLLAVVALLMDDLNLLVYDKSEE